MSHTALIQSLRCIMSYSSVTLDMLNVAVEGSTISSVDRLAQYQEAPSGSYHDNEHFQEHPQLSVCTRKRHYCLNDGTQPASAGCEALVSACYNYSSLGAGA
jgi:hypothetical protein